MKVLLLLTLFFVSMSVYSQMPQVVPGVSHDLAIWRAAHYSDVRYKLNLTLEKMSPVLKGTVEIRVLVSDAETRGRRDAEKSVPPAVAGGAVPIILDWRKIKGSESLSDISNVSINGVELKSPPATAGGTDLSGSTYQEANEHLIFRDGVKPGENVIKLDFTSPILTSGGAVTRYVDKEDGGEYIYSLFVPSDASTAFPVFDQPDLKARFTLQVTAPVDWKVTSNEDFIVENSNYDLGPQAVEAVKASNRTRRENSKARKDKVVSDEIFDLYQHIPLAGQRNYFYRETKPLSTYVFAFTAGPWVRFSDRKDFFDSEEFLDLQINCNSREPDVLKRNKPCPPAKPNGIQSTSGETLRSDSYVCVRKSQAEKFKPHATEIFRLMREGRKYLEGYFDFKFPFPKYDLVLIPEFPFGGMEHAGATFLREDRIIFPQEPTKNDYITRANVIFHETAHQWFGDTVTMKWFDDLWLKEGFAEFMAYKTLEKVMPEYNAWKVFYERNKQAAYATDSTKGTTSIYQPIDNLSAAKSAYGNIVYRKAPSFLRQAEFYLGEDKFQTAVRAFLKKHAFANAGWEDLVSEFEAASGQDLKEWAKVWVTQPGGPRYRQIISKTDMEEPRLLMFSLNKPNPGWQEKVKVLWVEPWGTPSSDFVLGKNAMESGLAIGDNTNFVFSNYKDYGYGIFLLDDKSRDYVLKNIQNEKDDFLRSMMWGSLWDSVREGELDPKEYVELVVKNIGVETDESTVATLLNRVAVAMNYYMSVPHAVAGGLTRVSETSVVSKAKLQPPATAGGTDKTSAGGADSLRARVETMLMDKIEHAPTLGQRITFYRAFLNMASTQEARDVLKRMLKGRAIDTGGKKKALTAVGISDSQITLKTKDRFDIVARLLILGDPDAPKLLADLEKTETSDEAKRYAYAAKAGIATAENKEKYWNDFINNKNISESWIESAMGPFNSIRQSELTLPYLERALAELPNLKRNRKIFFVNGWLGAFIGGQRDEKALAIVNKFLADNPNLDKDLRLKILENVDLIERAVKIRSKFH